MKFREWAAKRDQEVNEGPADDIGGFLGSQAARPFSRSARPMPPQQNQTPRQWPEEPEEPYKTMLQNGVLGPTAYDQWVRGNQLVRQEIMDAFDRLGRKQAQSQ